MQDLGKYKKAELLTLTERLVKSNEDYRSRESQLIRKVEHWKALAKWSFVGNGVMFALLMFFAALLRYAVPN